MVRHRTRPPDADRGVLDIEPPLNPTERRYLRAFVRSRRCSRAGGAYAVPGPGPDAVVSLELADTVAEGQPSLWCPWRLCPQGCCLTLPDEADPDEAAVWLRYLISHFLEPGATAVGDEGATRFAGFTADHVVDGEVIIKVERGQPCVIGVQANEVGEPCRRRRAPARRSRPRQSNVVDIRTRRTGA